MEKVILSERLQSRFNNLEKSLNPNAVLEITTDLKNNENVGNNLEKSKSVNVVSHDVLNLNTAIFKLFQAGTKEALGTTEKKLAQYSHLFLTKMNKLKDLNNNILISDSNDVIPSIPLTVANHEFERARLSFIGLFENITVVINKFEVDNLKHYDLFFTDFFKYFLQIDNLLQVSRLNKDVEVLSIDFIIKDKKVVLSLSYEISHSPESWCKTFKSNFLSELDLAITDSQGAMSCRQEYNLKNQKNYCNCLIKTSINELGI